MSFLIGFIGSLLKTLGFIFSIGGGWIWLNAQNYLGLSGYLQYHTYSNYSIPLLIVGVTFLVIGLILDTLSQNKLKASSQLVKISISRPKYCINCGADIPDKSLFCPNCGERAHW